MAQFSSLSGSGVIVGVLIIVLTMVFSPVTGQETTTELGTETTSGNMTESPNSTSEGNTTPNTTTEPSIMDDKWFTLPILIGGIACGVVLIVLVVVIIICCCRRRGPPMPVKRNFRLSTVTDDSRYPQTGEFPSDDEADMVDNFQTQATTDDIYGNVDNQGNVIRFNMPNEIERSPTSNSPKPSQRDFGDIYENNMPSLSTAISPSQGKDYGDVYENTPMGNVTQPVTISRPQPRSTPSLPVRPSPARKEEDDFGGVYTNEPIHHTANAPLNMNQELLQRPNKVSPDSHQAPSVPRKPVPLTPSQPSCVTDSPQKRPTNLPLTQRDNFAFEGDSPHDDVVSPLPKRPAPTVISTSQSLRLNPGAPNPGSRFNTLPVQPRESPPSHFTEPDDIADQPSRLPPAPPSQKPKKQTSTKPSQPSATKIALKPQSALKTSKQVPKKKAPPKTSPKGHIDRFIDDDVKGDIEMGDVYEVVETQKDFGVNYEVCDIQPKPSPNEDFGLSYESVDQPKQDTGTRDYGESYEVVETPNTQDYGGDYEPIERPKFDISHRAPMPTPESAAPYRPRKPQPALPKLGPVPKAASAGVVARSSPSHHNNSGADSDDEGSGEDYTNVPTPGGGRTHTPTHHPQPQLPRKLNSRRKDFYDDVLQAGDDDKEVEDDSMYQNDAPGAAFRHYRNVPAKREQPQKQGNYIQIQGKGH